MLVPLSREDEIDAWLSGTPEEAFALARPSTRGRVRFRCHKRLAEQINTAAKFNCWRHTARGRSMRNGTSRKPFIGYGCHMLSSYRIPKLLLPFAVGATLLVHPMSEAVQASPFSIPHGWAATKSIAEPVRRGGRGGGGFHRGGVARHGGVYRGGVARRGVYRGVARRGVYRGAARRGVYRGVVGGAVIGRRYYGGVYYGRGRRYWHGRWWPYGVGSCWRITPNGYYVWVCG